MGLQPNKLFWPQPHFLHVDFVAGVIGVAHNEDTKNKRGVQLFYFVNVGFAEKRSGIEHAQMKRLAMFKHFKQPAQIVTRSFSMNLSQAVASAGLAPTDMVNLFDFLRGTENYQGRPFGIADLHTPANLEVLVNDQDEHGYMVRNAQRIIQRISMRAPAYTQVDVVRTFDQGGHLVKSEQYDVRGFKGLEQIYDGSGNVVAEQVLAPDDRVVYQTFHTKNNAGKFENSLYRFVNYKGHDYSFAGEQSMMRFFLDELNQRNGEKNTFIVDRTFELAWSVLNMKTPHYQYFHIHSNHLNDPADVIKATLNYNYDYAIKNLSHWDGVLVPTDQQRKDFIARWGEQVPVYAVPVGNVADDLLQQPPVPLADRQAGNVIMVARLSPEKQQDQLIRAFKQVVAKVPQAHLTFWGYANGEEATRLRKVREDEGMMDAVSFEDYTPDIAAVYNHALINVLTSRAEGFALALLEAQSHGVPNIAYDVTYGPHDIIRNGENGVLVKLDDVEALADAIIALLTETNRWQAMSTQSYRDATRYSQATIWQQWQKLIQEQGGVQ